MKFKELREKIDDTYIDLILPPCILVSPFNTRSEAYDNFDVQLIVDKDRLTVFLK